MNHAAEDLLYCVLPVSLKAMKLVFQTGYLVLPFNLF